MGSHMDRRRECSAALAAALEGNSELIHASFSHNNFSTPDCEVGDGWGWERSAVAGGESTVPPNQQHHHQPPHHPDDRQRASK